MPRTHRSRLGFTAPVLISVAIVGAVHRADGENGSKIVIPPFNDPYSKAVRQLESGQTDINYRRFRESFLQSEQFTVAGKQSERLDALRQEMHELMAKSKYPEIVDVTEKMLSIDYTDMEAHKILQQTSKIIGDMATQKKHHDIEFGLLNSIVKNGDGKTCKTGWPVIQLNEEYFILQMIGAKVLGQSLDNSGGLCDKMNVRTQNEGEKTYYFEVSQVFKGYNKKGLK